MTKQWRGADFERRLMTREELNAALVKFCTTASLAHLRKIANDLELPWLAERAQFLLSYYCFQGDHTPTDFAVGSPCVCGIKKIGLRDVSHDADPRAAKDNPIGWGPV